MNLTSTEIFKLVWDRIRDSLLGKTVPMMYACLLYTSDAADEL